MEYLIAIILFPFVMFAGVMITAKKEQNDREKERQRQLELKNALNEVGAKLNDRTLVVSKRTAKFAEYLRIVPVTTFYNTKTPEKLNFGAVTVGGVTTGGTYVTGGHTITHTQKTKKCTFHFLDEEISEIAFSGNLEDKILDSSIKQYVDGKRKKILMSDLNRCNQFEKTTIMTSLSMGGTYGCDAAYLTGAELEKIRKWLSSRGK